PPARRRPSRAPVPARPAPSARRPGPGTPRTRSRRRRRVPGSSLGLGLHGLLRRLLDRLFRGLRLGVSSALGGDRGLVPRERKPAARHWLPLRLRRLPPPPHRVG